MLNFGVIQNPVLDSIPLEVWGELLSFLTPGEIANLGLVCKTFHAINTSESLDVVWQPFINRLKKIELSLETMPPDGVLRHAYFKKHFHRINKLQLQEIQHFQALDQENAFAPVAQAILQKLEATMLPQGSTKLAMLEKRHELLDDLNAELIKLALHTTILDISDKGLTRFPQQLIDDPLRQEYWSALKILRCDQNQLKSLPSLDNCSSLQHLICSYNQLTSLPSLKNCQSLIELQCGNNQITSLPSLDNCRELLFLTCDHNNLKSLPNLENCLRLSQLDCSNNRLTTLPNLRNCQNMTKLTCRYNQLTALPNLNHSAMLYELRCNNNLLTALPNLDNCAALQWLICHDNQIVTLPSLSNCQQFKMLDCGNNKLTTLPNLDNCLGVEAIFCQNNQLSVLPNLENFQAFNRLECKYNKLWTLPYSLAALFGPEWYVETLFFQKVSYLKWASEKIAAYLPTFNATNANTSSAAANNMDEVDNNEPSFKM
ncbi:MAG TPA: leucine-rich repeat domain-containing protein [Gammaproteobacteria bacterium]|nr:leucine-rich repeat domain-containing protein [Gammaproteobacteria bacterium]